MSKDFEALRANVEEIVSSEDNFTTDNYEIVKEFADMCYDEITPDNYDKTTSLLLLDTGAWMERALEELERTEEMADVFDFYHFYYELDESNVNKKDLYMMLIANDIDYITNKEAKCIEDNEAAYKYISEAMKMYESLSEKTVFERSCFAKLNSSMAILYSKFDVENTTKYFKQMIAIIKELSETVTTDEETDEAFGISFDAFNQMNSHQIEKADLYYSNLPEQESLKDKYDADKITAERIELLEFLLPLKEKCNEERSFDESVEFAEQYEFYADCYYSSDTESGKAVEAYINAFHIRKGLPTPENPDDEDLCENYRKAALDMLWVGDLGNKNNGSKKVMYKSYSMANDMLLQLIDIDYITDSLVTSLGQSYLGMALNSMELAEHIALDMANYVFELLIEVEENDSTTYFEDTYKYIGERMRIRESIYGCGVDSRYTKYIEDHLNTWSKVLEAYSAYDIAAQQYKLFVSDCRYVVDHEGGTEAKTRLFIALSRCIDYLSRPETVEADYKSKLTEAALRPEAKALFEELLEQHVETNEFFEAALLLGFAVLSDDDDED